MPIRKQGLISGEIYHVLNRGVDKRNIFLDEEDLDRFLECMSIFNSTTLTGSLYEQSFTKQSKQNKPLVNFISYNLLPNHFHFILEQSTENGISQFMKRLQGGYSWYFNNKNKRSGSLFQGPFKASHIDSNEYLLHASVYVNLNDKIKQSKAPLGDQVAKWGKSSWYEYLGKDKLNVNFCKKKSIILEQFNSVEEYERFAYKTLEMIKENKEKQKELE